MSQIPRQVADTPRPPPPISKVHAVSAFLRRSAFFHSFRLASYGSPVRRVIRHVLSTILGTHCSAGLIVPIVLLVINGSATTSKYIYNSCLRACNASYSPCVLSSSFLPSVRSPLRLCRALTVKRPGPPQRCISIRSLPTFHFVQYILDFLSIRSL